MAAETPGESKAASVAAAGESSLLKWLSKRSRPHFGQLATWLLLGASLWLARYPFEIAGGPRLGPASVFSWLPAEVLASPATLWFVRGVLVVGVALWFWRTLLPWSCWLTVFAFTLLWSLH